MDPSVVPDLVNGQAKLVGQFESGSPEWHAARAVGLGGSEIAAVVALSEWESYFSLYYRKKDKLRAIDESEPMKWGTLMEPVIYQEYVQNHMKKGLRMTTGHTFSHIDRPWQIANPDGLMWHGDELVDLLEIKNVGRPDFWGPDGSDVVPIYYRAQVSWYCDVLGLDKALIRCLISGNQPRTYRIKPSTEDLEYLREEGRKFIHALENDIQPDLDGHMATYDAIKEMHPLIEDRVVQVDPKLADRWWKVQTDLKAAEERHLEVKNQIAMKMGLARIAMAGEQKVAYRQRPRGKGEPFVKSGVHPDKASTVIRKPKKKVAA
nr:YqaJ viral recombinase family protein [Rhodococcus sp. (in: high G+C Gram-positive bacteria)]